MWKTYTRCIVVPFSLWLLCIGPSSLHIFHPFYFSYIVCPCICIFFSFPHGFVVFLWHKNFFLCNHFFSFELLSQLFIILIPLSFSAVCAIIETVVTQPWLFVYFYFRLVSSIYQYTSPICFMIWTVFRLLPLNGPFVGRPGYGHVPWAQIIIDVGTCYSS